MSEQSFAKSMIEFFSSGNVTDKLSSHIILSDSITEWMIANITCTGNYVGNLPNGNPDILSGPYTFKLDPISSIDGTDLCNSTVDTSTFALSISNLVRTFTLKLVDESGVINLSVPPLLSTFTLVLDLPHIQSEASIAMSDSTSYELELESNLPGRSPEFYEQYGVTYACQKAMGKSFVDSLSSTVPGSSPSTSTSSGIGHTTFSNLSI